VLDDTQASAHPLVPISLSNRRSPFLAYTTLWICTALRLFGRTIYEIFGLVRRECKGVGTKMERVIRESELVIETFLSPISRLTQITISLHKCKYV
jgi:membrane-bound metal-dependent hydrolase YbcI (DUF457 family)